ncbi:MAG: RNA polymerase sigma factor [Gemmatimonadota bacterium]|nr:RNA polymerase sigma factor [Gemmatimonadota bacterium]
MTGSGTGTGSDGGDDRGADEPGLVAAVQGGDTRAFSTLVARYMDPAYAVALSILRHEQDAEDAVQAAFIRALDRIEQLRPGSRFGPWFYRVLRSTCLNLRRRELLRSHSEVPDTAQSKHNVHREFEQRAARKRVLDALEQLPERQRTAVMMYDLEGYDHADIAEILEIAVGTSRANLHHGRQALRRILAEDGEEE